MAALGLPGAKLNHPRPMMPCHGAMMCHGEFHAERTPELNNQAALREAEARPFIVEGNPRFPEENRGRSRRKLIAELPGQISTGVNEFLGLNMG